ncbi:MAG: SH3-like domain-containing protein [Eubacterium sp.]|nr:SH3-like domain-containing protein [Eubacterium sp.]
MKRILKAAILMLVLLMGLGCVSVFAASGANGIFDFYEGMPPTTTDKYDIDGDGKKDVVSYAYNEADFQSVLTVNGTQIMNWDFKTGKWAWVTVVDIKNKDYLEIEVDDWSADTLTCGLYQVRNNQLKKVLDYSSLFDKKQLIKNDFADTINACSFLEARKVKGNTIYVGGTLATKAVGQVNFDGLKLNYKNGKFKLDTSAVKAVSHMRSSSGKPASYFTAKKNIKVYKKAGSTTKAFKIKKGQKFKVTKIAVVKKQIYLRVRTKSGKLGWIKAGKSQLVTNPTPYTEE